MDESWVPTIGLPPDCLTIAVHLATWATWKQVDEVDAEWVVRPIRLNKDVVERWQGCDWKVFPDGAADDSKQRYKTAAEDIKRYWDGKPAR